MNSVDLKRLKDNSLKKISTFDITKIYKRGDRLNARVSSIYDPTKFWMIFKYRELEALNTYLFQFYSEHHQSYKIARKDIEGGLNCVVFTGGGYQRAVIQIIAPAERALPSVKTFLYDYGAVEMVDIEKLYYMSDDLWKIPRFSLRACLVGLCPYNYKHWSEESITTLKNLLPFSLVITATVIDIDPNEQVFYVQITRSAVEEYENFISIHETLTDGCHAKYLGETQGEAEDEEWLEPEHEQIETGVMPAHAKAKHILSIINELL